MTAATSRMWKASQAWSEPRGKLAGGEPEQPGLVAVGVGAVAGEAGPAEHQREGHGEGQQAAPGQAGMGAPAADGAPADEALQEHLVQQGEGHAGQAGQAPGTEEGAHRQAPVHGRGRPFQPGEVAVGHAEAGEERGQQVAQQGRVQPPAAAAAQGDEAAEGAGGQGGPEHGARFQVQEGEGAQKRTSGRCVAPSRLGAKKVNTLIWIKECLWGVSTLEVGTEPAGR